MLLKAKTFAGLTAGLAIPAVGVRKGRATGLLRNNADKWLISGSGVYLLLVVLLPGVWTVGLGVWWILNTVAHNFIHQPFFRSQALNRCFAVYLSAISGVPQKLWRERHLAHHAERPWRFRISRGLLLHTFTVVFIWASLFAFDPNLAFRKILPGYLLGMLLCALQGHFEHIRGTTSNYGVIYNWLFFNDGFHVQHHDRPAAHWTALPALPQADRISRWPAVLRWLEWLHLNGLERIVIRSRILQRWVVRVHKRALQTLMRDIAEPASVAIIGGGLFPRTALVVHALWPKAKITIIEANADHLQICRPWLRGDELLVHSRVSANRLPEADLVVVPLAFDQAKERLYASRQSGTMIIVHDWVWKRSDQSVVTSLLLLKRMNLVT